MVPIELVLQSARLVFEQDRVLIVLRSDTLEWWNPVKGGLWELQTTLSVDWRQQPRFQAARWFRDILGER